MDRMEKGQMKEDRLKGLNALREDAPTPPASSAPRPEEERRRKG